MRLTHPAMRANDGLDALTDREKQTLRLIVRGHDAKSVARHLDLSVHTINERLRDARRKLAVSSSREAARQLLAREGGAPELFGARDLGAAPPLDSTEASRLPENGDGTRHPVWIVAGVASMVFLIGLAIAVAVPQSSPEPAGVATTISAAEVEGAARQFLTLVDAGKWADSYALTTDSFHRMNTLQIWTRVSEEARPPLGPVVSRTFMSHDDVPTPPHGYEVVKFRTSFANKPDAIEKVSLERTGNDWRVAGVWIE